MDSAARQPLRAGAAAGVRGSYPLPMQALTARTDDTARRLWAWLVRAPAYPPEPADLRTVDVVGLWLPIRATVAVSVTVFAFLFDYSRTFVPNDGTMDWRSAAGTWTMALERAVLFGLVPLLVIVLGFRDRPARYGLRLGDWRAGVTLAVVGCAVMTPIVLWFARLPDAEAYYAPGVVAGEPGRVVLTNLIDLTATEFLVRGFLMFSLIRIIGPFGVLVATLPFVFSHLGKPELELFSTLGGGLVYGWLAWRTTSIVWGALGHTYILSLAMLAAAR